MISNDYVISFEKPSAKAFACLREKTGWKGADIETVELSLVNSLFFVGIYTKSELIGMGRVVGDGAMYFYIQDVVVADEHQHQGVGGTIMAHIENYLKDAAKTGATIGLLASVGKEDFYSHFGYQKRPNTYMGHGMCKFV